MDQILTIDTLIAFVHLLQISRSETFQNKGYRKYGRPSWIFPYSREITCTTFHALNISYLIVLFTHKIPYIVLYTLQFVSRNMDSLSRSYDMFTWNTCLRLVSGLIKRPIFHRVYLTNYNSSKDEIFTKDTLICFGNIFQVSWSDSLHRIVIAKMVWWPVKNIS